MTTKIFKILYGAWNCGFHYIFLGQHWSQRVEKIQFHYSRKAALFLIEAAFTLTVLMCVDFSLCYYSLANASHLATGSKFQLSRYINYELLHKVQISLLTIYSTNVHHNQWPIMTLRSSQSLGDCLLHTCYSVSMHR